MYDKLSFNYHSPSQFRSPCDRTQPAATIADMPLSVSPTNYRRSGIFQEA
jgi:hypothetical protein